MSPSQAMKEKRHLFMFLGRPQFAKYICETHTSNRLSFDNSLLKGGPYFARQTRPFSQKSCFPALNDFEPWRQDHWLPDSLVSENKNLKPTSKDWLIEFESLHLVLYWVYHISIISNIDYIIYRTCPQQEQLAYSWRQQARKFGETER